MNWKKLGLIFSPDQRFSWMQTHAANPLAYELHPGVYRIYFATRDINNRSSIAYIDYDLNSLQILTIGQEPILVPGPLGFFDDYGVYPASIVKESEKLYMYYTGWNPGPRPHFYTSVGLAVSEDNGVSFTKKYKAPILARNEIDPWMVSQPFVWREQAFWRMCYISGLGWSDTGQESFYHLKYATSANGIDWHREGLIALDLTDDDVQNIARPCIIQEEGLYKMWFSYNKGIGYRLGYATSQNGIHYQCCGDTLNLSPSNSDFDSQAIAYPWVVNFNDRKFLFYNGNDFGREGIGLAVEDE